MGYLHIDNLYKNQAILEFKECYALEKIHGTSAHISYKANEKKIILFAGGEPYTNFAKLFDIEKLTAQLVERESEDLIIFGEAYGGKQQAMSHIYGNSLKFIAFDVKQNNKWLTVPHAESVCKNLGIEFVWYTKINTDLDEINKLRDGYSEQAKRNGCGDDKFGEGIILKTVNTYFNAAGDRVIAKHKREEFRETKSPRPVKNISEADLKILTEANEVADEWVTPMRLNHILDKIPEYDIKSTGNICEQMFEDIKREAAGEIVLSDKTEQIIKTRTAKMFKEKLQENSKLKIN